MDLEPLDAGYGQHVAARQAVPWPRPRVLMRLAGLLSHEQVQVVDLDNGARLVTYVIQAPAGSPAITDPVRRPPPPA